MCRKVVGNSTRIGMHVGYDTGADKGEVR